MDTDITKTAEEYHLYDINDCIIETLTVIRRESLKLNKKLCLGIQIFSCFQVLSLIFSPKASLSLPWNYSSLEIIWIVIGLIARPYLIIDYLNISILVLMIIPICYLFMVAMYLTIFLNIKKRMNIGENITQVGTNYILIIRTESLLRYLLLDAGYLSVLMLHRYLFEWTLAEDQDYQYAICLFCLITLLYLPLIYTKGYYLMALKWNTQAYNTMSHPQPYFYYKVAYMALVYSTVAVKFESKPAEYAIIFMVCGGYLIILFAYIQPYVQFIVNFIQCIKGLALFLAGLIMFVFSISGNCNQESYTATLAFFITLPFLSYFMKELMVKRRNYVLNKQDILSNTYESFIKIQEHRSMQYSKLPENENFMTNVQTIRKAHRNNFYINIWLLYYLLDAENWGGICLFLSKIRRLTLSIQQKSFVQEFKEEYYKTVRINQEYGEAIDFLSYRKKMSALSDSDKTCCYTILRIYEHFSAQRDIHKLSQLIVIFMRVYRDTKDVYSSLLKAYPKTVELLQYYVGFLEIIENSTDKGNTITTLQELNSENKTYVRYGSNMLNACSLSLLVSLEKRNLGTVKWVYNTSLFGYYDDQLAGDSYFKLFPSSLKNYLYRIHKSRKNYFYLNDLFSKTKSLYIILNNRFLQLVSIKFRIANMEDNSICGVVSFSKNNKGVELALLSEDGRRIVHMTEGMHSYLSIILKLTTLELYSTDFLDRLNITAWKEDAVLHHYTSHKFNLITKTVTYVLYESVTQKSIVVMSKMGKSTDNKYVKKIHMEKILNHFNISNLTSTPEILQPRSTDVSDVSNVSFCLKTQLPANLGISQELEEIGLSSNATHVDTPGEKEADKNYTNTTSNKYSYLKQIPKQSTIRYNKLLRVLMVSVVLVVLLNLVINFTLYGTLQTSINDINQGTEIMNTLAKQRYSLSQTVFYSKQIYLQDLGTTFSLTREELINELKYLAHSFKDNLKSIQEYNQKDNAVLRLSNIEAIWLEYHNGHFEVHTKNLVNILDRIITLILKYTEYTEVTGDNPYLIEMYRNGFGEVMQGFNITVEEFGNKYDEMIVEFVYMYQVVMIISICLLAMLQSLGLAYVLYIMNKERVKIWKIIENIPKQVISSMLSKLRERLMDKFNEDLGEVTSKYTSQRLIYKHSYYQKKLYILTFLFVAISLVSVTYIYTVVLPTALEDIKQKLRLNDWTSQQQTFLYTSAFWTRECGYELDLLKEYSTYIDPKVELEKSLKGLEYSHKEAFEGRYMSSDIEDIYLGNFNSTHQFDKGLHSRVRDIITTYTIICYKYRIDLLDGLEYAKANAVNRREIEQECNLVIEKINLASEEKIRDILANLLMVILLLLSAMVLLILVGLLPVVMKLKDMFEKEAHFISFVPLEDSL